jgi:hypothetical protein
MFLPEVTPRLPPIHVLTWVDYPGIHVPQGWDELLSLFILFLHFATYWIIIFSTITVSRWILSSSLSFLESIFYKCRLVPIYGLFLAYPCLQYVQKCSRELFPPGTVFTYWVSLVSLMSVSISHRWKHHHSKRSSRLKMFRHMAEVQLCTSFGTRTFTIPPGWKVIDFKKYISTRYRIRITQQRLVCGTKELDNDRLLSYYKIKHESTIKLFIRGIGGNKESSSSPVPSTSGDIDQESNESPANQGGEVDTSETARTPEGAVSVTPSTNEGETLVTARTPRGAASATHIDPNPPDHSYSFEPLDYQKGLLAIDTSDTGKSSFRRQCSFVSGRLIAEYWHKIGYKTDSVEDALRHCSNFFLRSMPGLRHLAGKSDDDDPAIFKVAVPLPTGIHNEGETCWLNSIVQCISATYPLRIWLYELCSVVLECGESRGVLFTLVLLLIRMQLGAGGAIEATDFWYALKICGDGEFNCINRTDEESESNDINEFYTPLLDYLRGIQMSLSKHAKAARLAELFYDTLFYSLGDSIKCDKCGNVVFRYDNGQSIFFTSIPSKDVIDLERKRQKGKKWKPSISWLIDLKNKGNVDQDYKCPKCGQREEKIFHPFFASLPLVLPVVVN